MDDQQLTEYEKLKAQKEKQLKRQNDYAKQNYDRIGFVLPKGYKSKLETAAGAKGFKNISEYIKSLLEKDGVL